jgi:hypothetical protein
MELSDDELRLVLARAEEIQRGTRQGRAWEAEVAAVVQAAEGIGISREAVERALHERFGALAAPPKAGETAWAVSVDGNAYVADVVGTDGEMARVRFLHGGEHTVPVSELRHCAFPPGEKVMVNWPWWGAWKCAVTAYDAYARMVTVDDGWGERLTFPIAQVWQAPANPATRSRRTLYLKLMGAGAAIGVALGTVATALLMR